MNALDNATELFRLQREHRQATLTAERADELRGESSRAIVAVRRIELCIQVMQGASLPIPASLHLALQEAIDLRDSLLLEYNGPAWMAAVTALSEEQEEPG